MRSFVGVLVLGAILLAGCKGARKTEPAWKTQKSSGRKATAQVLEPQTTSRPVDAIRGRILAVREDLRFVIIDFPPGRLPKLEQRLSVYRLDQKVAEVRVSGPYLGTTVAADITAGSAMEGDLVRDQ